MSETIYIPHSYRVLTSGDCVPIVSADKPLVKLELNDDGTVTWAREENS